ncbi:MAG: flavodoxin [Pseudoxanthomonas sp.]
MHILLAYTSLSGNTREVARAVAACCKAAGHRVDFIEAGVQTLAAAPLPVADYDLYLLGSWSDNAGRTPSEMKHLIAALVEACGRKPAHVAAFGTGETQWGEEYFCGAVHRIARFFDSCHPPLCIEQMPHGERDTQTIIAWTDRVLAQYLNESDEHNHADPHRRVA